MKTIAFGSQLSAVIKQLSFHHQRLQNRLIRVRRSAADAFRHLDGACHEVIGKLQKICGAARLGMNREIPKLVFRLYFTLEQAALLFEKAQHSFTKWAKKVGDERSRSRARRSPTEVHLWNLTAASQVAAILTDSGGRLTAANPKALDLLGVSESNVRNFSIDAFLVRDGIGDFAKSSLRVKRRRERRGQCKIRRLDGRVSRVEYIAVCDIFPYRHLYKFFPSVPRDPFVHASGASVSRDPSPSIY
jgi:PAS domain S-box-containing protein